MILARYNLAAPNSEPLKVPVPAILMLSALGVSAFCAAAVFLFLLAGEQHAPDPTSKSSSVSSAPLTATKPTETKPLQRNPAGAAQDSGVPVQFERTDFSLFKSRSYRATGPVKIRLLRTKKDESCDIAVLVNNRRTKRLGATVGTAIEVTMPGSLPRATLVVTGIANNRVWGYLMAPRSTVKSSAVTGAARRNRHSE